MEEAVRFELLGPLRARRGFQELNLGPARQQAVLAVLLLAPDRAVAASEIVDQVWGDEPPANGANVVQKYVAGLRRILEPDRLPRAAGQLLVLTSAGYRLTVAPGGLDLDVFAAHVAEGRRLRAGGHFPEATAEIRAALSLWRSEPLAGLTGGYFAAVRAQLAEDRAAALEEWAELELEQGHEQSLLPELSRLIAEWPLRQRLRAAHLLALYRTGRQAEALTSYQQALQLVGGRPGPELQAAYAQILQTDVLRPAPVVSSPAVVPEFVAEERRPSDSLGWKGWTVKVLVALVPIVTFGLAGGPTMAIVALRRRSWRLGVFAFGYFVTSWTLLVIFGEMEPVQPGPSEDLVFGFFLLSVAATSIHLAFLVPRRAPAGEREQAALREQARLLVATNPQLAREIGVGRPDLPQHLADGGLIELNGAPAAVLRELPGVPPEHSALIIAERNARGPFRSLEDAVARGMFPWPVPRQIADVVLVIPVQDAPKEERR